jgi:hypothetical protein
VTTELQFKVEFGTEFKVRLANSKSKTTFRWEVNE